MNKILVIGHLNPDTDSITSAISFSFLQNQLGKNTEAVALGECNEETLFALNYFKFDAPRIIDRASNDTKDVMLVDHNEFQQAVSDISELNILAVIDHHRIANFQTASPLYYRAEAVGCTQTIILKIFKENSIAIPKNIAGLMLSGIISDTLLFKSPTCTEEDVRAAEELSSIAEVDINSYGLDLLKAGTNLSNKTAEQLIHLDAKSFEVHGKKIVVSQVNAIDFSDILSRKNEILDVLNHTISESSLDLFVFVITNILEGDSKLISAGSLINECEKAFNTKFIDNEAFLKGVVSRKKQIIPSLMDALS